MEVPTRLPVRASIEGRIEWQVFFLLFAVPSLEIALQETYMWLLSAACLDTSIERIMLPLERLQ